MQTVFQAACLSSTRVGAASGSLVADNLLGRAQALESELGRADVERRELVAHHTAGLVELIHIQKDRLGVIARGFDVRVKVTTAVDLSDAQKSELTATLKNMLGNQEPVLDVKLVSKVL